MKTLGTFVVGAAVGFVACGALTIRGVLNSERHRKAIAKVVSEKVNDELFGEKSNSYRVEYSSHEGGQHRQYEPFISTPPNNYYLS